ncbi:MAG: transcriptional regulator [Betaproteobacteria bacterium]|nr:transcriptional regulator [Betaproteobacteria bacterium]
MALPININDLLNGKPVEWERLEFKAGWNPEAVLQTLCAFANDINNLGGGYILIGVAEHNGRPVLPPVGLDPAQIDTIQKELLNLGLSAIAPYYHPIAVPVEIDGRHVLVLWALGGPTRPYNAKISLGKDGKEFAYYIRKGSRTIRARGTDETELMSLAATVPHDDRINAVYHRGYDTRESVEIRLERDEMMIISYPGPDRSIRLEQLQAGRAQPRRYRNRRIGEFLKELEFTEGRRCTGIPKIIQAMEKNGSPPPEFEFDEDHSYFMVRLPVHPAAREVAESATGKEPGKVGAGRTAHQPGEGLAQSLTQSSDPVERLLIALKHGEQSSGDLREALGIRHRQNFRENYLHPALKQGLIEYTLPNKPNSRLQQYRLTDKGRARLANRNSAKP